MKDLASAILAVFFTVYPFYIQRDIAAVAYREHASVDDIEILGKAVCSVQDHAVSHADVVRSGLIETRVNRLMNSLSVKFISDVEVGFHVCEV